MQTGRRVDRLESHLEAGLGEGRRRLLDRKLEGDDASGREDTHELAYIGERVLGAHVVEDDVRVDKVEGVVGKEGEVVGFVEVVAAAVAVSVVSLSLFDH